MNPPLELKAPLGPAGFQRVFEATPSPQLVLSPDFTIIAVNDAYLRATMTRREAILGMDLFTVFPDNPEDVMATGVGNLKASLTHVLQTRSADAMPVQKYDIRAPLIPGQPFQERYWSPVNSPVLDERGEVLCIIHRVEEVTDFIRIFVRREQELRVGAEHAKARLELVLNSIPEGFLATDRNGRILFLNERLADLLHGNIDELLNQDACAIAPPAIAQALKLAMGSAEGGRFDYIDPDGRWWSIRAYPAGAGVVVIATDISAHKESESALLESQAKYQLAIELVGLGYSEINLKSGMAICSAEWSRQMGYGSGPAKTNVATWLERVHVADRSRVEQLLTSLSTSGPLEADIEYRLLAGKNEYRWVQSRVRILLDAQGQRQRLIGTQLDITERKAAEEHALHEANLDKLTGLPNRHLLYLGAEQCLSAARRCGRQVAILFLDLDGFKPVNDNYGHRVGDKLLQAVARSLRGAVRAQDMLGRVGGDEFIAVLADIDQVSAVEQVAEHVVEAIERPKTIDGERIEISTSIGISLFPKDGESMDRLIQHADLAMYVAKKTGHGRHEFFNPGMLDRHSRHEQTSMVSRLRDAMETDALYAVFQPVVDLAHRSQVRSAEVLLRWRQDDGSYLSPQMFLPVAESSGLINAVGDRLLRQALRQRNEWQSLGLGDIGVSVNVSPAQFRQKHFVQTVAEAIDDCAADAGRITLEMAESVVMANQERTLETLLALKKLGVNISLDGFGTGYSNIQHLSRLPIDLFKVHASMIRGTRPKAGNALNMVVALGRSAHADIVAEGIENTNELTVARRLGCRYAQGFHVARPMPAPEFAAWLGARRSRRNNTQGYARW